MRAEIKLTDVKDIRDLHEYINAELRLRRVAPTLEALQAALENLPERDQRLISLRYYAGKTQSQTAAALNMTQVQVSRREKKILALLREGLSTE